MVQVPPCRALPNPVTVHEQDKPVVTRDMDHELPGLGREVQVLPEVVDCGVARDRSWAGDPRRGPRSVHEIRRGPILAPSQALESGEERDGEQGLRIHAGFQRGEPRGKVPERQALKRPGGQSAGGVGRKPPGLFSLI